jgi:MFS transporter, CP family, cyanate transporter
MSPETDTALEPAKHPFRWAILGGVWLIYFCFGLVMTAMAPLVGPITSDLNLSHSAMGSVLGAWQLVYIASALPSGAFLDRVGTRRALFLAVAIIAVSGVLRSQAGGVLSLFLAVAFFGLGGPLVSVGLPKLISQWFEGSQRGFAMGVYITGPLLGAVVALSFTNSVAMPMFGGDWRAVLLSYAAFTALSGIAWLIISGRPVSRLVESQGSEEERPSQLAAFRDLIGLPAVRIVLAMSVGIFFFNHGLNNWLPEILRSRGMDAATAGFWAAVPAMTAVAGALLIPRLATPPRRLGILLVLICAAATATLLLHLPAGFLLGGGLVLQGIARGAMMTVAILTLVEIPSIGSRRAGLAGGLFFSAAETGGVLGPLTIGVVSDLTGGFSAVLNMLTVICAILLLLLVPLRRALR